MSIMEISHRSAEFEQVHNETQQLLKQIFSIPDGYQVQFLQGGASTQFAMIPLNFLKSGKVGKLCAYRSMGRESCSGEAACSEKLPSQQARKNRNL